MCAVFLLAFPSRGVLLLTGSPKSSSLHLYISGRPSFPIRTAHQRLRVEQLQKRQVELSQMLTSASAVGSAAGSVMGDREDLGCLDDDFGEQVALEPGALLLGSPFLLQRQLQRVNKELQSIPFSVTPEKKPVDASAAFSTPKRVVDEKLRVPTPKQLAEDRALKQAKTVRRPD
eukprot:RCo017241